MPSEKSVNRKVRAFCYGSNDCRQTALLAVVFGFLKYSCVLNGVRKDIFIFSRHLLILINLNRSRTASRQQISVPVIIGNIASDLLCLGGGDNPLFDFVICRLNPI